MSLLSSVRARDRKDGGAFRRLHRTFDSSKDVVSVQEEHVTYLYKLPSISKKRKRKIQSALGFIIRRYGKLDLSGLSRQPTCRAEEELTAIPGVGANIARYLLLHCFGRHVLPVDIHTYRLAIRLGILSRNIAYDQSHDILQSIFPWNHRRKFHINAVSHVRKRCRARRPLCDGCPVTKFCSVPRAKNETPIIGRPKSLVLDLFSGAGGMSQGFRQSGFEVVQSVDKDRRAADTYSINHRTRDVVVADLTKLNPLDMARRIGLRKGELTAIVGGPPCQGFSESNRRTRTLDNPKNSLYQEFFRYVSALRPLWFVLENVAGIKTLGGGLFLRAIVEEARKCGYSSRWQELNAAYYGVPQSRRRIFVIGNRIGAIIRFPVKTHGPDRKAIVTIKDALSDLPVLHVGDHRGRAPYRTPTPLSDYQALMRNGNNSVSGNLVTRNSTLVVDRYRHIKQGCNWEAIPRDLMKNYGDVSRCHTGIYYRLKWNEPSKVVGNYRKNMLIHPGQNRGLSVREAARLQSFPDHYEFIGSIGFQQQQVGDAVPPLLAEAVARSISS